MPLDWQAPNTKCNLNKFARNTTLVLHVNKTTKTNKVIKEGFLQILVTCSFHSLSKHTLLSLP
jgi:hypothetical protein